jgi:hypothetical protein
MELGITIEPRRSRNLPDLAIQFANLESGLNENESHGCVPWLSLFHNAFARRNLAISPLERRI